MRRTILLADDSPTIQRLVTNTFADADYEIISVSNGEAAIKKFEEIHPHVVLADIYMPGKNGYEVCAYVRQHRSAGDTPVVLLVGAFDAFDEDKAKEIGATANITKPFEPHALVALVESVMPRADDATEILPPPVTMRAAAEDVPSPAAVDTAPVPGQEDLLGLESLFHEPEQESALTEKDVDRIADRVIQRLSTQVIESIAWEIVPDVAEKIVREEFKKHK
jgi:DNA-binding response OmpR family regulator